MSHTDPGEQLDRGRVDRRTVKVPDAAQIDMLGSIPAVLAADIARENERCLAMLGLDATLGAPPPEQPRRRSAGLKRKDKALANHESGHEDRLGFIREKLKELYAERKTAYLMTHPSDRTAPPFVTADDAAKILKDASNLGYLDDDERRNWFGALFRGKGWRWVEPKLVPSLRDEMNGRMQRTWAWEPAP